MQSIGYRHMLHCLAGEWDRATATEHLIHDTRRYAKRQMTWFRNQQDVRWYQIEEKDKTLKAITDFLDVS